MIGVTHWRRQLNHYPNIVKGNSFLVYAVEPINRTINTESKDKSSGPLLLRNKTHGHLRMSPRTHKETRSLSVQLYGGRKSDLFIYRHYHNYIDSLHRMDKCHA